MASIIGSLFLAVVLGYLWGSLPSGYWMGKLLRGKDFDIRDYGSHKTGATNVLRTLGAVPAAIVFVFDISKGIGPTLLATLLPLFHAGGWGAPLAGIAALLGHCFPVFIGFKGGRGVMTAGGALLVISPLAFGITALVTLGTIAIWRYVSLGSIAGSFTAMVCGIAFFIVGLLNPAFFGKVSLASLVFMVVAPGLVIIFHHDNIRRLLNGTERKLGQKVVIAPDNTPANPPSSSKQAQA
jgi:glycerol-3-phosphate acyltransferase PlsY